jgi:hypothetical protein
MMFGLFDSVRTTRCLESLNGADICTDWGVRSLARTSTLFEPTNYNYGAVWPFIGSFFNTAQFRHRSGLAAYQILEATIAHATADGIGVVPEVFSGELNQKLGEAYHHQGFSTTGYMLPFIRGLLGLTVDAGRRTIGFAPVIPANWDSLSVRHISVNGNLYNLLLTQSESEIALAVSGPAPDPVRLEFAPPIPAGSRIIAVTLNGLPQENTASGSYQVRNGDRISVTRTPVPAVLPPHAETGPGATNEGLRVLSCTEEKGRIKVRLEGRSGRTYLLPIAYAARVGSMEGATLHGAGLEITFEQRPQAAFIRHEILITPKKHETQ